MHAKISNVLNFELRNGYVCHSYVVVFYGLVNPTFSLKWGDITTKRFCKSEVTWRQKYYKCFSCNRCYEESISREVTWQKHFVHARRHDDKSIYFLNQGDMTTTVLSSCEAHGDDSISITLGAWRRRQNFVKTKRMTTTVFRSRDAHDNDSISLNQGDMTTTVLSSCEAHGDDSISITRGAWQRQYFVKARRMTTTVFR